MAASAKAVFDESELFSPEGVEGLYQSIAVVTASVTVANPIESTKRERVHVLLFSTQDCHIRSTEAGDDALITDPFIPANVLIPFVLTSGFKISAIRDSADGTLHISPVV